MTINLLTARIKAIKKELLALKTSHTKSAFLLKIFSAIGSVPIPAEGATDYAIITVNFSQDYGAYPYFRFAIEPTNLGYRNSGSNIYIGTETYGSNGYSIEVEIIQLGDEDYSNNFKITSTSPITSISYEWI